MKEVERILAASLAISSLALVLAIVCFPLLQFNLNSLTNLVHKDIDEFKVFVCVRERCLFFRTLQIYYGEI